MKKSLMLLAIAAMVCACGAPTHTPTRGEAYPKMYEEKPLTLLVMPPINNSSFVEAKDLFYTSISFPLAEAGYYIISPLLAMDILKAESAYDAELFVDAPLNKFKQFFGADAVVFTEIDTWTKRGFGIETDIRCFIKSTTSGEILFDKSATYYLDLSVRSGSSSTLGALIDLAASAINTAVTEHIQAARLANRMVFEDLPQGKYDPDYMQDQNKEAKPDNN
ncbi:MAG: DUF799 family lipoprotein [Bacteroidales bacterium]|nr:DUF799 family lipoprotein [Bacteroidales bacterium]